MSKTIDSVDVRNPHSVFFEDSAYESKEKPVRLTQILTTETDVDGNSKIKSVSVESVMDPLSALRYDDFTIRKLLASGISPKSLAISKDLRLGFDDEIEDFNSHVESIANELFNSQTD